MKNYQRLKGMVAAVFTPFKKNGELNLSMIDRYADHIASSGIFGVFVCGTTGEFASLTIEERKSILEKWVEAAKGRFKVIAHVGSNCQKDCIELASHAVTEGADAIASIAPSFFKPGSVNNLVDFFKPIAAAATDLPFYYYNMPSMTGVDLPVHEFLHEGKKWIPNLVGTKFTHNNLMDMEECLELDDHAFEVLHGFDETLMTGLALGAVAGVGSTYNYIPQVYREIFDAMKNTDLQAARKAQKQSVKTVSVIVKYGGGVRGGKAIMKLIGIDCGSCRSPFSPFAENEYILLKNDLKAIGFNRTE
jgi:N-acetylneuraminate lyase